MRAPAGETVVPNGKLGLVASILVEKYLDGLPLHRQRDRYLLQPIWRALLAGIIDE